MAEKELNPLNEQNKMSNSKDQKNQKFKKEYKGMPKYYKFALYIIVIILINLVGIKTFYRADLTSNNLYSLSSASKNVIASLKEPLTINVFFSKNLPAPYNNIELYLHDLLQEYSIYSNNYLSYRFYDVTAQEGELDGKEQENRKIAESYGIYPVNVQKIEQDEAKVQRAYMGIAIIHGDLVEKIPSVTSTEGLEYKLTTAIQKMTNKVSALVKLPEKIKVSIVLSSSLSYISRMVNMQGIDVIKFKTQEIVDRLNAKTYGQLQFESIDPSAGDIIPGNSMVMERFGLQWPEVKAPDGSVIPAGKGVAAIQLRYGKKTIERNLLNRKMALTQRGIEEQFSTPDPKEIETFIYDNIDNLIEINENIGYLSSNGTLKLTDDLPPQFEPGMPRPQKQETLDYFNGILKNVYTVKDIKLDQEIPDQINTLIIAGPKDNFSEWQLFQIDQFLMKGKSLALFVDSFNEIQPQNQQGFQQAVYLPINNGLEKLLDHYGLAVKKSYVLDESCFVNKDRGGEEMPIYFVPIIKNEKINHKLDFLENLTQLVFVKLSPIEINQDRIKQNKLNSSLLFESSEKSWEMAGQINLMPFMIQPPTNPKEKASRPLAYVIEGEFPSYFAGKPVPEKPQPQPAAPQTNVPGTDNAATQPANTPNIEPAPAPQESMIKSTKDIITHGKPGKIFIIGSAEILKNNVLDEEGVTPNATFLLNTFDYLNGREDIAIMRGKNQKFNPLDDTKPFTKNFVKAINIAGLPLLIIALGIFILIRRARKKRKIQAMFSQSNK